MESDIVQAVKQMSYAPNPDRAAAEARQRGEQLHDEILAGENEYRDAMRRLKEWSPGGQ